MVPRRPLILLIEDDHDTALALSRVLESDRYRVAIAGSGAAARKFIQKTPPDLILLELVLPDTDGLSLTRDLKVVIDSPIIICSARQEQIDRVLALKLGADDFVAKPFDLDELEARIEAVLRRASRVHQVPAMPADQIRVSELLITRTRGTVTFVGQAVQLAPIEYHVLVALASRPDEVLTRETLRQLVWGDQDVGKSHIVDVYISRLRLKLRRVSRRDVIITVPGKGYTIGRAAGLEPDSTNNRRG